MQFCWHENHEHLSRDSSTLSFQHGFEAIRRDHPELSRFRDPAGLLDALHHGTAGADEKNQLLKALIRAAQADGTAADCALTLMPLALWPGLDAIFRRAMCRQVGSVGDVSSEVLARATEAICCLDLLRVERIAATILRNIERDLIRERRREVAVQKLHAGFALSEAAVNRATSEPQVSPERLRRDLVRLVGADATLVMRVAVDGASQADVSSEFGLTAAAARKRYQRALRRARETLSEAA